MPSEFTDGSGSVLYKAVLLIPTSSAARWACLTEGSPSVLDPTVLAGVNVAGRGRRWPRDCPWRCSPCTCCSGSGSFPGAPWLTTPTLSVETWREGTVPAVPAQPQPLRLGEKGLDPQGGHLSALRHGGASRLAQSSIETQRWGSQRWGPHTATGWVSSGERFPTTQGVSSW